MKCSHVLLFSFLCNAVSSAEWDYIVVGGGASGCVVGPELARDGKKVLLLEAGGPTSWAFGGRTQKPFFKRFEERGDANFTVFDMPGENERIRHFKKYWWQTTPWTRQGRGIGGSGMMNGALTFIPSPQDFDEWPSSWNFTEMEPFYRSTFQRMSLTTKPSSDGKRYAQGAGKAFDRMTRKRMGMKKTALNDDPRNRINTISYPEVSVRHGQRLDACMAYLLPALETGNIELMMNSEVGRILFKSKGVASGVVLKDSGEEILLKKGGKLVITAGTFLTARLLMLSGIGPRPEVRRLYRHGLIQAPRKYWIRNNALGVGIHDHLFTMLTFRAPDVKDFTFRYWTESYSKRCLAQYFRSRKNAYAQYGPIRLGFIARRGQTAPEVELLGLPSGEEGSGATDCGNCFRIMLMLLSPKARDNFHLKYSNSTCDCGGADCRPGDVCKPDLYLSNKKDKETIMWAVRKVVKAAKKEGYEVLRPSPVEMESKASLEEHLDTAWSSRLPAHHFAGTCRVGACTDGDLKVKGTDNIYVADSSLFPAPVRAHNVGTVFAVALKAAGHISGSAVSADA
ncbi:hypothetical protein BSKO_11925 [Bryopsis sp. KO-2023]|nr:hypothetical protein BSKO_11925 [Bryopsis sp. KO-2023]